MEAGNTTRLITPNPNTTTDNHLLLPWIWAIESLAAQDSDSNQQQLNPSLLNDLIRNATKLRKTTTTHDSFMETHMERLALYQLEDFLSQPTTSGSSAAAAGKDATLNKNLESDHLENRNRIVIDLSDRAQDVLRRLLDNMKTANMKMPIMSDSIKSDIRQFILHKRAALPKLFGLQQLKSAILEGVDQSASRFREITGSDKEDQLVRILVKCLRQRSGLEKVDQQDNRIPVNDDDPAITAVDNRDENMNDVEIQPPKENSCHLGVPENGNQHMLEDPCGKDGICTRKVSPEQNHDHCLVKSSTGLAKGTLVNDGDGRKCIASKKHKQGNDSQIQHNLSHFPSTDGVIPEEAHLDGHHQKDDLNGPKGDSECHAKLGTSSVFDRNLDKVANIDSGEEMVIVAEKRSFLSSQNTTNQDYQATAGRTEGNICLECNEGGQLLTCCVSDCPSAVHERCLRSSFNVSDSGNFYCPYCSYRQALAAHRESKKKTALVKDKVALAKNHLSEYISVVTAQRPLKPSELAPTEEQINSRMVGETNFLHEIHVSRLRREIINNQPMQAVVSQKEADHQRQVMDHENQRVVEDQELAEPCATHHIRVEDTTLNCENTSNALLSKERGKAVMNEDQPSVSKKRKYVEAHSKGKTAESSRRYAMSASIHRDHADVEKEIEDWMYAADTNQEPSCQRNVNAYKVAENQDHDEISNASRKRKRFATRHHSNSGTRQIIPWSVEEEEILQIGVDKFSSVDKKIIPWTKILEFGSLVFEKSRTPTYLKYKWRNIWAERKRREKLR